MKQQYEWREAAVSTYSAIAVGNGWVFLMPRVYNFSIRQDGHHMTCFVWSRMGSIMSLLPGVDAEVVSTAVREHQTAAVAFLSDPLLKNKYY